jgi:hypothetical protein
MAVHVLGQPAPEARQLARGELLVEVRQGARRRPPQLRRSHVADGVGREVAELPPRPVDVLQHPACVVGHRYPSSSRVFASQAAGQVGHRERPLHERDLELEAQDDVQGVRHLVGVDADERRLHDVDRPQEVAVVQVAERSGAEQLARPR